MSTARKKGSRRGGGGRKRYSRKQGATLHVTTLVGIAFVLWKMGLLDSTFWANLQQGNLSGMVAAIQTALNNNFASTAGAINTAIQGGALAVALMLIRKAVKGGVPLRKVRGIAA